MSAWYEARNECINLLGVFKNAFLFSMASRLTDTIPAQQNLLVVIVSVVVFVGNIIVLKTALQREPKGTLAVFLAPITALGVWMLGIASYMLSQFIGTTFSRFLNQLPPHGAASDPIREVLPITLFVLAFVGLALRIYASEVP